VYVLCREYQRDVFNTCLILPNLGGRQVYVETLLECGTYLFKNKFKALNTLLKSAEYTITRKRLFLFPCLKILDAATGGLYVTITSQFEVYAPAERAYKLLVFLL
jgi:hypothetical protein